MVDYSCLRCGYIASQKINLKHHLNRKNICKPILEDISIKKMYEIYNFQNDTQPTHAPSLKAPITSPDSATSSSILVCSSI